jgi:glutaminase
LAKLPDSLSHDDLESIATQLPLLLRSLQGDLAVPNFSAFCDKFEELFHAICEEGKQAGYLQGDETLDIVTVDGQRMHLGRSNQSVPLDELSSLLVFIATRESSKALPIMNLVGHEPSGEKNSSAHVNADGIPYNPFTWNGMLALLALLVDNFEDAWSELMKVWSRLSGQTCTQHNEAWEHEDRTRYFHHVSALLHGLIAAGTLPATTKIDIVVSLFFHLRSLVAYNPELARMAALFGNGGLNVFTGERILHAKTVKDVLTLMFTTGCGAMSGEFTFRLGVPAKSTAVGCILLVVPNTLGMCIFGQTANRSEVSIAAWKMCCDMSDEFNFHALAGNCTKSAKLDPSLYHFQTDIELCNSLLWAASKGDLPTLVYLHNLGFNLNYMDYDQRSAAHLAAAHGQLKALRYLKRHGAEIDVQDRWGNMPIDDAKRNGHEETELMLRRWALSNSRNSSRGPTPSVCESTFSTRSNTKTYKADRACAPVAARLLWSRVAKASGISGGIAEITMDAVLEEEDSEEEQHDEDPEGLTSMDLGLV